MAARYMSYDTRSSTSSHFSDPSSSVELNSSSLKYKSSSTSRAIVKSKPLDVSQGSKAKPKVDHNLAAMVKRFVDKKSASKKVELVIPCDVIAEDLKKTARKGVGLTALQKKLFGKGSAEKQKEVKALTEVKGNTRTLAMVLRSERELLSANKDQEMEIAELKLLLEEKNREVEKLKDLCLKQREEIKGLKSAILFPDVMNSQLHELLEKQGSELRQAKQLIPSLQRQVTSLTGQLQCLAVDLAEVKADNHTARACFQHHIGSSPRTPSYDNENTPNSLEFSSGDPTTPDSPDDMLLKDLNPCLTPYCAKTKSKEFEETGYDSPEKETLYKNNTQMLDQVGVGYSSCPRKLSKSSDCCQGPNAGSRMARTARRSDESKGPYRKQMHHTFF
ncbi:hypothetical protein SLEP1_g29117 [Rubroshorea leprosula]|uniref:Uncharacterized protein n=1 Tax=Rubroshorea leprosula TaxID=152421 RepID=A0AAV5K527_9ROSI|nr:hypothetical protein SLEP1_g29117 [Rubroshorea leprosula]